MLATKNIFVLIGSASQHSANQKLIDNLATLMQANFHFILSADLKTLPHFDPELSSNNPPKQIIELRNKIEKADGILICTPEYIFSIPSGLKNVIEWCIATTVFSNQPTGLITASASGEKAHKKKNNMNENDKIKQAITNFVKGGDNSDIELLNKVLHKDFRVTDNGFWRNHN